MRRESIIRTSGRRSAKILLIVFAVLSCWDRPAVATYYVSNEGADENDGRSPQTSWRTIARVNGQRFEPGDVVLLRRGDCWREQLVPSSGSPEGHVTYGAYGSGEKPQLLGSVEANDPGDWTREGGNIWSTTELSAGGPELRWDVGNIIFDGEAACGVKVFNESDLDLEGEYWYDERRRVLKLVSPKSPAEHYSDVECALRRHIIDQSSASYVIYENLALKYGGAHGIGGGNTHHVVVRDCDLSFIGGGDQQGGDRTVRYGNGIEFWAGAHDHLVERCRLWEIYDAALTNQNNAPRVKQINITYRHNLIWNCEYSFEYWNRPENSLTENVRFENNTCLAAGHGWGHTQRPDPSGRHLCFYTSPAAARGISVQNNIFLEAKTNAFYAPGWPKDAVTALRIDHNCWYQGEGVMVRAAGAEFPMTRFAAYQSEFGLEPHSIVARPAVADAANRDFHLTTGSPCIDAGPALGFERDFDGNRIPQGNAPDIGAYEFQK